MSIKTKTKQIISVQDFDELVIANYGKPYSFQQQDGCKSRGMVPIAVPETVNNYDNDTIPEIVNHNEMGVSFKAWLERDPEQVLTSAPNYTVGLRLWWYRNFYPDVSMIINDLHSKGLLPAGDYLIEIDW